VTQQFENHFGDDSAAYFAEMFTVLLDLSLR
jgi:hypothetical protein